MAVDIGIVAIEVAEGLGVDTGVAAFTDAVAGASTATAYSYNNATSYYLKRIMTAIAYLGAGYAQLGLASFYNTTQPIVASFPLVGGWVASLFAYLYNQIVGTANAVTSVGYDSVFDLANSIAQIVGWAVDLAPTYLSQRLIYHQQLAISEAENYAYGQVQSLYNTVSGLSGQVQSVLNTINAWYGTLVAISNAINTLNAYVAGLNDRVGNLETYAQQIAANQQVIEGAINDLYTSHIGPIEAAIGQDAATILQMQQAITASIDDITAINQQLVPALGLLGVLTSLVPIAELSAENITSLVDTAEDPCRCMSEGGDYSWVPALIFANWLELNG